MPRPKTTRGPIQAPKRNVEQVIEFGLEIINRELQALHDLWPGGLSTFEAQSLGIYLKSALAMAKEEREAKNPGKLTDGQLDAEIAKHLGIPLATFNELLVEAKRRASAS